MVDYRIVKINQITEKSPGDLRRLIVTQTPVKAYLETYLIMLSVKQGGIKYHFLTLWYWD